jgi:hypothetical protein
MTEKASSDDYSGSSGYGPHRRHQPGHLFRGQIVSTRGGHIWLAHCTTLLVRRDAILTLIRAGSLDRVLNLSRVFARDRPRGSYLCRCSACTAPTGGKKRWKERDSNPRPRHYEECGRPNNLLSSITYTGAGRSRRKIRHCWRRQIPVKSARNPPRSTNPKIPTPREQE